MPKMHNMTSNSNGLWEVASARQLRTVEDSSHVSQNAVVVLLMVSCLTQGVTWLILPGTDVQSSEENSMVVPFPTFPHQT